MTKNARTVWLFGLAAGVLVLLVWAGRDYFLTGGKEIQCSDGPRRTIDLRNFRTQYSAYSVEFEGSIADKGKFGGKISPVQLQQLSESLQQANEFRKWLVAGYNSCAITRAGFEEYGKVFQSIDSVAREIDRLSGKTGLTEAETAALRSLVDQFITLSQRLAAK